MAVFVERIFRLILSFKRAILCVFLLFVTGYISFLVFFEGASSFVYANTNLHAECMIPNIDPFDKDILPYYWKPNPIVCSKDTDLVFIDAQNMMHINFSRVNSNHINCSFQVVVRKNGSDDDVTFGEPVWFQNKTRIKADILKVRCFHGADMIYERIHSHVYKSDRKINSDEHQYSVFIFGIDSMSRLAALRELPKTVAYLQNTLNAYILKGFTKVGGNSLPNLAAFLSGRQAYTNEFKVDKNIVFDNYPLVWRNFSAAGGITMFAEDWPRLSTFNYEHPGFNQQPTDHYFRPFYLCINALKKYQSSIHEALMFFEDKHIKFGKTSTMCHGDIPRFVLQINYFKQFLQIYRDRLRFGMSWLNEIGHDYVNFIKLGDTDFLNFLTFMKEDGHLKKSVLIFLSDHGSNVDKIRNTPIGRIEERLPFIAMVLPDSIKLKYPHIHLNLLENIERVTSPFDVYETIIDILSNNFNATETVKTPLSRGISLFKRIPKERSCADAHIGETFCACHTTKSFPVEKAVIKQAAYLAVTHINKKLAPVHINCEILKLKKIKEASIIHSQLKRAEKYESLKFLNYFIKPQEDLRTRYLVLIEVSPSSAWFEVTVEQNENKNELRVIGEISRTNRYGNQSSCISDKQLKPFCYCKR